MDDLITTLGLEKLTQEERDSVLVQITDSLLKRLILRVYDKLTEKEQEEFDRLAETKDQEKINAFLTAHVPDLDEIRDEELDGLVNEMKEFSAEAQKRTQ